MKKLLTILAFAVFTLASCKKEIKTTQEDVLLTESKAEKKPFNPAFHYTPVNLNGVEYLVDTFAKYTIGPGAEYMQLNYDHETHPLKVHIISIDATNPYISFKPVLGDEMVLGTERVTEMAARKTTEGATYFAGVNADYFNNDPASSNYGRPWNATVIDDIAGSMPRTFNMVDPLLTEAHAMFDSNNAMSIDNIVFAGTLTYNGTSTLNIDRINTLRGSSTLVYCNKYNGARTRTNNQGTEVVIMPVNGQSMGINQNVTFRVTRVRRSLGNTAIPEDGAVLTGNGTVQEVLDSFRVGDEVTVHLGMQPQQTPSDFTELVGGMQIILKDSALVPMWFNGAEVHPRTGIGHSGDKTKTFLCVIDGRWPGVSVGVTTEMLAQIMRLAGATDALNLDGGGSSTMYARNAGYFGLMNRPQGGTFTRSVGNAIYAVSSAPASTGISKIVSNRNMYRLEIGDSIKPVFYGLNEYGHIVNNNLSGVTIDAPNGIGTISGDKFVATGPGRFGKIRANYNGLETTINVVVGK